jgi:hypothetical protein
MIIGICGLIGSGKGTVADILQNNHNFTKISFADSLKDAVSAVFGWDRSLLEGDTDQSREFREQTDKWWADRLGMADLTPRLVLQKWGTEVCRDSFHQDIWTASMERKISELLSTQPVSRIVIPDTRFPNEIQMIQRMEGQVWHVKRGADPEWFTNYQSHGIIPEHIHASEWAWAQSEFDQVIQNNGTFIDLEKLVALLSETDKVCI